MQLPWKNLDNSFDDFFKFEGVSQFAMQNLRRKTKPLSLMYWDVQEHKELTEESSAWKKTLQIFSVTNKIYYECKWEGSLKFLSLEGER